MQVPPPGPRRFNASREKSTGDSSFPVILVYRHPDYSGPARFEEQTNSSNDLVVILRHKKTLTCSDK